MFSLNAWAQHLFEMPFVNLEVEAFISIAASPRSASTLESTHEPPDKERGAACPVEGRLGSGVGTQHDYCFSNLGLNLLFLDSRMLTSYSRMNNLENLSCLLFIAPFVNHKHLTVICIFNMQ